MPASLPIGSAEAIKITQPNLWTMTPTAPTAANQTTTAATAGL
ncbi:hypothetical protein [Spongiactinospora gelatinilytica]|nr:hypothetical protein [Spongiactinospora gelatinilytica]